MITRFIEKNVLQTNIYLVEPRERCVKICATHQFLTGTRFQIRLVQINLWFTVYEKNESEPLGPNQKKAHSMR